MGAVVLITIGIWATTDMETDNSFRGVLGFVGLFASLVMLLISGITPIGDVEDVVKKATNTRVGDELIIQSNGFPTQKITDIGFIDKPVNLTKRTNTNAWGGELSTEYIVTLDDSEK